MNTQPKSDIESFCAAVVSRLGLSVGEHNMNQVSQVLERRIKATGCESAAAYLQKLGDARFARAEVREAAAELGVGETYFFRHPEHFRALADIALPQRIEARKAVRQLRLLSAGCASGEEAYSLAASLAPFRRELSGWDVRIVGVDANPQVLDKARVARYSEWSLRGLSESRRSALFSPAGRHFAFGSDIASMVSFEELNLLEDAAEPWPSEYFDVIFCRNVTIYFTQAATAKVVERLTRSLVPGGYLFLGPSETLRGLTHEFHLRHTHDAFYYQKRLAHETVATYSTAAPSTTVLRPEPMLFPGVAARAGESWVTAIGEAAGRIAALADRSKQPRGAMPPVAPPPLNQQDRALNSAMDLLRLERFAEALESLGPTPRTGPGGEDPDTLLLRALLLANTAQVAAAEVICGRLLADDDLNAPAHYLMAVCQEHRGDYLSAAEHDQAAIYLDGEFAFPHLHLGLLARRLGDLGTARKELTSAVDLLRAKDAPRIWLFGGGFDREALVRLCQSNLQASGGQT